MVGLALVFCAEKRHQPKPVPSRKEPHDGDGFLFLFLDLMGLNLDLVLLYFDLMFLSLCFGMSWHISPL